MRIFFAFVRSILPLILLVQANSARADDPSGTVTTFAGNAQHTAIYQPAAQNLNAIHWSTSIDLNNSGAFAHYGAPLITAANTVLVPVKTVGNGFQVNAFDGSSGTAKYTLGTDYVLPSYNWIPVYNPALATSSFGTRLYYPGPGGTIYHIDNPDSAAHGAPVQEVFYTTLANYSANAAAFNTTVFINTPVTADSDGNVFFGFRVQGTAPAPLSTTQSGFARIDPSGNATYVLAGAAAGDGAIGHDSHNSAPGLSNDETTLYVVVKSSSTQYYGYLLGLDSTTLATKHKVFLKDPRNGGINNAGILDNSTASPTIAPDNDVYLGIFGNPYNGSRGFLLRFSSDLTVTKTPGGFGWDYTPALVPASMVPSYQGPSSYLIFAKYNNYAIGDGDGVNRIALFDPNATQIDPHPSANGLVEMREVLTVIGPTPDHQHYSSTYPYAVREWCINTAAVNPATSSIFIPNEDGRIYRWNLANNSLSQGVALTAGLGQPYVPTIIGPGGIVYTLNGGTLFALGSLSGVGIVVTSSVPSIRTVVAGQSLTFTATITDTASSGFIPSGTVTFQDLTYQDLTPVTTTLASAVPLNASGQAAVTTSSLTAGNQFLGNHFITATYSGDAHFGSGSMTLVQKVHASASTTTLNASPNPVSFGQAISFAVTVAPVAPIATIPSGMVTFREGAAVLAQVPLGASGTASFNTSALNVGAHTITADYYSDTVFASSSGNANVTVTSSVVGRMIFYNNSAWDGNGPLANVTDDAAIATAKTALLPGGTAALANYTSYSRGLNGIMVDIANLPGTPTVSDFVFKTGNSNNLAGWSTAPDPTSVTVRAGAGTSGSGRVTLIWNDNNLNGVADANEAVAGQWLEVTVKATANTGLPSADVFYFGNAAGESGNSATEAEVSVLDAFAVVNHLQLDPPAAIDNPWDFDRNRLVSIVDAFIPVNHIARFDAALQLIDLSGGGGSASSTASSPTTLLLSRSALALSLAEQAALNAGLPPTGTGGQVATIRLISVERLETGETRLLIYAAGATADFEIQHTDNLHEAAWRPVAEQNIQRLGERLLELTLPDRDAAFIRLAVGAPEPAN